MVDDLIDLCLSASELEELRSIFQTIELYGDEQSDDPKPPLALQEHVELRRLQSYVNFEGDFGGPDWFGAMAPIT